MTSPIKRYGGKHYMIKVVLPLFPNHEVYVEPFAGAAHLFFSKNPSTIEILNDIDGNITNFFRVLRDKPEALVDKLRFTPYGREEFTDCRDTLASGDDVERARKYFVVNRQSFAGNEQGYAFSSGRENSFALIFISRVEHLFSFSQRLRCAQIENNDFVFIFEHYDTEKTFFYVDPPYVLDSRRSGKAYRHEMDDVQHKTLIDLLLNIKGKAIVSGYANKLYDRLSCAGWLVKDFSKTLWAKKAKGIEHRPVIKEKVWVCPRTQDSLNNKQLPLFAGV